MIYNKELRLLLIVSIIFGLSLASAYGQDATLPIETNKTKHYLDDYFQPSLVRSQLYTLDAVDAGGQQKGAVTRKQLEAGTIAVFRYGNQRSQGGYFPQTTWAPNEIQRIILETIDEYLWAGGIDPFVPDEYLDPNDRAKKKQLIQEATEDARNFVGYTRGEQKQRLTTLLQEKEKELGRPLTSEEKETVRKDVLGKYPLKHDSQTDEVEGIAIVNNMNIYQVYDILKQRDRYMELMPNYFLYSHVLTAEELAAPHRRLKAKPHEQFLFARFKIASYEFEYTAFNDATQYLTEVELNTKEGKTKQVIPGITSAWRVDPRFVDDGRFEPIFDQKTGKIIGHNGKFGQKDVLVMDGYLTLEPYIAKDENGYESVDTNRVLAIYHTYTRIDPDYADLTGLTVMFREAEGRKFMQNMVAVVRQ
ncbi:MAG: hypothetical protein A3B70_05545 [Deltaproteobacteria bacterium RIFCSPHIGHO2_02_FULL_40_11]|nr:MAG: hypothetical protein A3B70_05545 [Deltaproteobacteria bacterium RIFCSPHIGHO2_02_FULL_40_11]